MLKSSQEGSGRLRRLYAAQFLTQTAVWFRNFAVSLLILELTGSASALAWVTVIQFLPLLLLGPLPGRWADHGRPRRLLLAANVVSLATVLALAANPLNPQWLWGLYALLAVSGVAQAFERPAAFGLTAHLVGSDRLGPSLARHTVAASAGRFIGPGLAGLAYAGAGPKLCFLLAAALSAAVIGLVTTLPDHSTVPASSAEEAAPVNGKGLDPLRRQRPAFPIVMSLSALVTVAALNFNVTVTSMMTLELQSSVAALGLAHTLNAIGAIGGGLAASARTRMGPYAFGPAAGALGGGLLLASGMGSTTQFLVLSPLLGAALGWYQSVLQRAAQTAAGPGKTASAASWVNVTTFGLTPVAALWAGYVTDAASPRTALVLGATGAMLAGGIALVTLRRENAP